MTDLKPMYKVITVDEAEQNLQELEENNMLLEFL
jgi:hypothetical protein